MQKKNDKPEDKMATTDSVSKAQDVALGNEEKKIADKSELGLKPQQGQPISVTTETTLPPKVVDTDKDDKEAKDSDENRIYAEYEKGAFNPEQIAQKFNTTPAVVYEVIEKKSVEKHGEKEDK